MSNFKIFETDQFIKELENNLGGQVSKIEKKLKTYVYSQLKEKPYFGKNIKKLTNCIPETWRYRIGNYRFFYEIDDKEKIVFMITSDHRSKTY